jgi:hypothetical protein
MVHDAAVLLLNLMYKQSSFSHTFMYVTITDLCDACLDLKIWQLENILLCVVVCKNEEDFQ